MEHDLVQPTQLTITQPASRNPDARTTCKTQKLHVTHATRKFNPPLTKTLMIMKFTPLWRDLRWEDSVNKDLGMHSLRKDQIVKTHIVPWDPDGFYATRCNDQRHMIHKLKRNKLECFISLKGMDLLRKKSLHWSIWFKNGEICWNLCEICEFDPWPELVLQELSNENKKSRWQFEGLFWIKMK